MVIQEQPVLQNVPTDCTYGDARGRVVQRGDLLLVARGFDHEGPVACATVKFDAPAVFSNWLIRLRADQDCLDPDYLRLYLASRQGRAALAGAATGSVIANLRREALNEVEIYLPSLEQQKRIVGCLTAIEQQMSELTRALGDLDDLYDTVREGLVAGILGA